MAVFDSDGDEPPSARSYVTSVRISNAESHLQQRWRRGGQVGNRTEQAGLGHLYGCMDVGASYPGNSDQGPENEIPARKTELAMVECYSLYYYIP